MAQYVLYTGDAEWDALYIDGQLDLLGDRHHLRSRFIELLGVEVRDSDAYFLGREPKYDNAAETLSEVEAHEGRPGSEPAQADLLRAQANELLAQADQLDRTARDREVRAIAENLATDADSV